MHNGPSDPNFVRGLEFSPPHLGVTCGSRAPSGIPPRRWGPPFLLTAHRRRVWAATVDWKKEKGVFDWKAWTFGGFNAQLRHKHLHPCICNLISFIGVTVCGVGLGETRGPGRHFFLTLLNEFLTVLSLRTIQALKTTAAALNETPGDRSVYYTQPGMGKHSGSQSPVAFRTGCWEPHLKNYASDRVFSLWCWKPRRRSMQTSPSDKCQSHLCFYR